GDGGAGRGAGGAGGGEAPVEGPAGHDAGGRPRGTRVAPASRRRRLPAVRQRLQGLPGTDRLRTRVGHPAPETRPGAPADLGDRSPETCPPVSCRRALAWPTRCCGRPPPARVSSARCGKIQAPSLLTGTQVRNRITSL